MNKWEVVKNTVIGGLGIVGSAIATIWGGLQVGIQVLVIFIAIDYICGLIVAGIFKKSGKTENGALESRAGWKGLVKKVFTLVLVFVAYQIDRLAIGGGSFITDAVVIFFVANEGLSIVENTGLMGVPYPEAIKKALELLKSKSEE